MSEQSPISANGVLLRVGDLVAEANGKVVGESRRRGVVESVGISSTSNRPDGVFVRLPLGTVSSFASRWVFDARMIDAASQFADQPEAATR